MCTRLLCLYCLYLRQITVTSGGMYTEKLDSNDLNLSSRKDKFVGSFAYGQNKVKLIDVLLYGVVVTLATY